MKQGFEELQALVFLTITVKDNIQNLLSKGSVGVKFKEGICTECIIYVYMCLKLWFESD